MSRNDKSKLLDNLVFDYIQYEIDTPGDHINKECEVRFCTKQDRSMSKHQFDKLNWLRHVKAARLRCQNFELTQMERMRKFMEKWKRRRK